MKRIAEISILTFLSLSLAGCIVQSLQPFYKEKALIEMPGIRGEWILMRDAGKDASKKDIEPWVFSGDKVETFDEKGRRSILKVRYFKVENTVFVDVMAGEPDQSVLNKWWYLHVMPVHSVARVMLKDGVLTIIPLNYSWLKDAIEAGRVSLPHIRLKAADMTVFNVDSDTWMAFLKKYKDDKDAFTDKLEHVFKRHQPDRGDHMKGSKKIPDDFSIQYRWREGSVPPPDHYEYTIHLGPGGEGELVFYPDYPMYNPPNWSEQFQIDKATLERLYRLMEERGIFSRSWTESDEATGGALESVRIRADGMEFTVPGGIEEAEDVKEVYRFIRSTVPEKIWDTIMSRREKFVREYHQ